MNRREDNKRPLAKCDELRALPDEELLALRADREKQLAEQQWARTRRGRGGDSGTPNPGVIKNCKKEIARINTVLNERKKQQQEAE